MPTVYQKPSGAFVGASWAAVFIGTLVYVVGLWNAPIPFIDKSHYFSILVYGLFSAVSLQKAVRDRMEDIPVTGIYYGLAWLAVGLSAIFLIVGLWDAKMTFNDKSFYVVSYLFAMFGAVAVQKNVRDTQAAERSQGRDEETAS